jgi:hypothetical protein
LDVAGGIKSTMWNVSKPIPYAGSAYPRNGTFTSNGGTLMIFVSGSASGSGGQTIQLDVKIDGNVVGSLKTYTITATNNKPLVTDVIIVSGVSAGSHTVSLVLAAGSSDNNDYSQVTILELPF